MAREIPTEDQVREAIAMAADLPRLDAADLTEDETERIIQFGNNFYMLFSALFHVEEHGEDTKRMMVTVYLGKAKKLDTLWEKFLAENTDLLDELRDALKDYDIYSHILGLYRDFCVTREFDAGDEFDLKFHPEIGLNSIGVPIWRRLNELLKRAADAMKEAGIDPTQFYG